MLRVKLESTLLPPRPEPHANTHGAEEDIPAWQKTASRKRIPLINAGPVYVTVVQHLASVGQRLPFPTIMLLCKGSPSKQLLPFGFARQYTAVKSQNTVAAYFQSKRLLSSSVARLSGPANDYSSCFFRVASVFPVSPRQKMHLIPTGTEVHLHHYIDLTRLQSQQLVG